MLLDQVPACRLDTRSKIGKPDPNMACPVRDHAFAVRPDPRAPCVEPTVLVNIRRIETRMVSPSLSRRKNPNWIMSRNRRGNCHTSQQAKSRCRFADIHINPPERTNSQV